MNVQSYAQQQNKKTLAHQVKTIQFFNKKTDRNK